MTAADSCRRQDKRGRFPKNPPRFSISQRLSIWLRFETPEFQLRPTKVFVKELKGLISENLVRPLKVLDFS